MPSHGALWRVELFRACLVAPSLLLNDYLQSKLPKCRSVSGNFSSIEVEGECILSATPVTSGTGVSVLIIPDTSGDCASSGGSGDNGLSKTQLVGIVVV